MTKLKRQDIMNSVGGVVQNKVLAMVMLLLWMQLM